VDALLAAQDKLIAKKRDIKQATMQQLLTGKQRLRKIGENGEWIVGSAGNPVFFSGEWEVKRLGDICWYQEGPGVRNYQFTKQGVKLLNGTNIAKGKVSLDTTNRYISEAEAFGSYKHFLVDDGDILIASSGVTIDKFHEKVAFASSDNLPLCMNTSTIRFKVNATELLDDFLYFFLQSDLFKEPIGKQATGSAQLNFGPAHLNKISVSLPPSIEEQLAIATVLSDMDTELAALEQQRDKTRALKQGMMQVLLTGKIRLTTN
jgi:type I restriction enzyme S subunit